MKSPFLKTILCSALFWAPALHAATVETTWQGGSEGTLLWEDNDHWTSPSYPSNGVDAYQVTIGDASGNRVIQTQGDISISRLYLSQSSSSGSNTLRLGGDLTLVQNVGPVSTLSNTTNDASKLVLDLNGHTFHVASSSGTYGTIPHFTLTGGGTYSVNQFYHSSGLATIGSGVTVRVHGTDSSSQQSTGVTWQSGSTLHLAKNTASIVTMYHQWTRAQGFHHVTIGTPTNTVSTLLDFANAVIGAGAYVNGNLTLLKYNEGGDAARFTIGAGKLNLGGNLIDEGTDALNYGTGTIIFEGGAATTRTVSVGRSQLTNAFQVGSAPAYAGNIELARDLTTTGNLTVLKESTINLGQNAFTAGNVDIQATSTVDPTLAFTFGLGGSGLIEATGSLDIDGAVLNITFDGTGWAGGDLDLFRFDSFANSLLTAGDFTVNTYGDFTYDALVIGENSIYLSNVAAIPEPGSVAFLGMAGLWLGANALRRRRRQLV